MNFVKTNWEYCALTILVAISLGLHVYRISYPDAPEFDEVHFATYAADYVDHRAFFDIHPPLGKLIYAGALLFFPKSDLAHSELVSFTKTRDGSLDMKADEGPYGDYPYVALRLVSAFFGIGLPLVFYWLLRTIGLSALGSILGAFFVTFENALLLDTRLILLDGMYLYFGCAALALYFDAKRSAWIAGIILGLSLGVKLIGIVFLIPAIIMIFMAEEMERKKANVRFLKFAGMGLIVLIMISAIQGILFTPRDRISFLMNGGFLGNSQLGSELPALGRPAQYFMATIVDGLLSLKGYTVGNASSAESPWYLWPAMFIPIPYYISGSVMIMLRGNPVVWLGSTLAVACGLAVLPRYLWAFVKRKEFLEHVGEPQHTLYQKQVMILLSGYIGSIIPFFTVVRRSTFLYHYFPALLFGIGLLSLFLSSVLQKVSEKRHKGIYATCLAGITLTVILGFVFIAPTTYGFPSLF